MHYIYGTYNGPVAVSGVIWQTSICPKCNTIPCACTVVIFTVDDWEELEEQLLPEPIEDYPHKCPDCGGPAYIGLIKIDCMMNCKETDKTE